ncbi:hypothetical protein [Xylanimonas sp. McL0601]|uniref:hypothetical protein n=1 Tax=Xylanimonas sp. McL0601 TaxID=3414739 RepID=UPI003CF14249
MCELADPFDRDALWSRPGGCHWQWLWDGHGLCSCEMCHGGYGLRAERRADRQRTNRVLRVLAHRWNAGEDDSLDVA